jgi:hypothetical protein
MTDTVYSQLVEQLITLTKGSPNREVAIEHLRNFVKSCLTHATETNDREGIKLHLAQLIAITKIQQEEVTA